MAMSAGLRTILLGAKLLPVAVSVAGSTYVLAEGDSNTAGSFAVPYPTLYKNTTSAANFLMHNSAVSGSFLSSLVSRASADLAFVTANPGYANYVLTIMIGTNETSNATYYPNGAAQFATDLTAYIQSMTGVGKFTKVVLGTIMDESFGTQSVTDAWLASMNAAIRGLFPTYCDAIFDLGASRPLGVPGSVNNPRYWLPQPSLHINSYGQLFAETLYAPAVNKVTVPAVAPGAPTGLTTGATTVSSVALTWTPPATGGYYTDFVAQYALAGSGAWQTFSHGPSRTAAITVTGLTPSAGGTSYDFRVAATGEGGQSAFSATSTVSTQPTVVDAFDPTNVGATITLSNGNVRATGTSSAVWGSARSAISYASGKHYAEFKVTTAAGNGFEPGVADTTGTASTMSTFLGGFANSAGVIAVTGNRQNSGFSVTGFPSIPSVTNGDVYGIAVDVDNKKTWLSLNNTWLTGDPVAGTGAFITWAAAYSICAALGIATNGNAADFQGSGSQTYSPPSGFTAW